MKNMLYNLEQIVANGGAWIPIKIAAEFAKKCEKFNVAVRGGALNNCATEKYFYVA